MNERIREFAIQTDAWCDQNLHDESTYNSAWEEKFAKLIIQECIKACQSRVGNSDYNTGRMHCVSDIKEQFGVE